MAKARYQDGLTIITPILPGEEAALAATLQQINDDVEANDLVPFRQCERIHFARWVVLPAAADALGRPTPASLVFSSNYDAPVEAHLEELYDRAAAGLDRIYGCCRGYPTPPNRTKASVLAYLRAHDAGYNTLYVGTRGLTVVQIRREAALRDAIEAFLDQQTHRPGFLEQDPAALREAIQAFVRAREDLRWAREAPPEPRRVWPSGRDVPVVVAILLFVLVPVVAGFAASFTTGLLTFLGLLGVLAVGLAVWAVVLRGKERRDEEFPAVTDYDHVGRLASREDFIVQNQMSSTTNIKPGWLRRTTLRVVLWAIDAAGRYVYTKGSLGSIPSIHFARWVVIDEGRRLLFFSNFDGSWENYLGDFIDKAAGGLTAVWSNTYGFPRTRWLFQGGAADEQRFKAYARNSQIVTQVWYSAYKRLSVQNIQNNAQIRAGLFGRQTPSETAAWLQRF